MWRVGEETKLFATHLKRNNHLKVPANEWKANENKCSQSLDKKCGTERRWEEPLQEHQSPFPTIILQSVRRSAYCLQRLKHCVETSPDTTGTPLGGDDGCSDRVSVYTILSIPLQIQSNQLMTLFQCCLLTATLMILSVQVDGERYTSVINSCSWQKRTEAPY